MKQSPFFQIGPKLIERGYSAIPICPGSKAPGNYFRGKWEKMGRWSELCERLPTDNEIAAWSQWPDAGVGVCLGPASGIVAVDFDTQPDLWPALQLIIGKSPVTKRGEKGFTAFFRYSGEVSRSWYTEDRKSTIVDLLSTGRQTILPPTIHPTTRLAYEWGAFTLAEIGRDELPALPPDTIERFDKVMGGFRSRESAYASQVWLPRSEDRPSVEMIEAALRCISPDLAYPAWRDVGMAIHSVYPDSTGFGLYNSWSSGGSKYHEHKMARMWASFKPGAITIASLFALAKDGGFSDWHHDEDKALASVSPVLLPSTQPCGKSDAPEAAKRLTLPDEFVLRAPGLVGEITHWILETAIKPQPVLALAAALTAVGVLKGHRVKTETNLRTNIYALGLARSGSGKNHPMVAVREMFRMAGISQLVGGEPGSEPGLVQIIREGRGRSIIFWDEMGHAIAAMANPRTGAHYSSIMSTLTKLFSNAGSTHDGKVLAAGARESLDQPCLCVFGVTVPERFFETLTSEHAIDGFLPRWLAFEVETNRPQINRAGRINGVPPELVESVIRLQALPTKPDGSIVHDLIAPRTVPFSDSARDMYWDAQEYFDDLSEDAAKAGDPSSPVWVRAAEHAAKIALTIASVDEITESDLAWALELVNCQCQALCSSISSRIGQNSQERNVKKVLGLIRRAGDEGLTKTALCRETQWLTAQERAGIIATLVDSEQVQVIQDERKGKGQRAAKYRAF